MFGSGQYTTY